MTDDTDDAEPEKAQRVRSLPLIDTFAALQAELDAKEQRIERLEGELAQGYLDPHGGDHETAGAVGASPVEGADELADTEPDGSDLTGSDPTDSDSTDSDPTDNTEIETRSHKDWEPATDPLSDSSATSTDGDHEGVTPAVEGASLESNERRATSDADPAGNSGLKPVRTASTGKASSDDTDSPESAAEGSTSEEFGVTMEASTDLTGGSLGSSTDGTFVAETSDGDDDDSADRSPPPDPTADRGERLSRLVRRVDRHDEDEVVETFVGGIDALDDVTREMLAHYREAGDAAPVDAHLAAGGSGERQYAYARNRTLRKAGVIEHDGAGRYRYALPELVEEAFDSTVDGQAVADAVAAIEAETGMGK